MGVVVVMSGAYLKLFVRLMHVRVVRRVLTKVLASVVDEQLLHGTHAAPSGRLQSSAAAPLRQPRGEGVPLGPRRPPSGAAGGWSGGWSQEGCGERGVPRPARSSFPTVAGVQ